MDGKRNYEAVLFDLDGTVLDTYDIILASMRHTVNGLLGLQLSDEQLTAGVGTPLEDQMTGFAGGDRTWGAQLTQAYRAHNDAIHDAGAKLFPGVTDTLQELQRAGVRMGVVTSKRHELAARGLALYGTDAFMEFVIGPEDSAFSKPHPGPVQEGCARLGLSPAACLYVGDSPYDLQAGNAAGCHTAAATWGMFSERLLRAEEPTYVLDSFSGLVDVVLGRAG